MDVLLFKNLKVWERAIEFADSAITLTENLNTNRAHFRLVEQLESAAASVALNIAEGKGRNSKKEYIHFLYISRGSIYEAITLAIIFNKRGWITDDQLTQLENAGVEIAKMLKGLINSIYKTIPK